MPWSTRRSRYSLVSQDDADPSHRQGTFWTGPRHCRHYSTQSFTEYGYELNPSFASDPDCRAFAQNSCAAAEIYDDYVYIYDPDYTRRICRETWHVQAKIAGEWTTIDTEITSRYKTDLPNGVAFTKEGVCSYNLQQVGTFKVSYTFTTGRALKHDVYFTNTTAQPREVRVVQTLIGIAGKRARHALGDEDVTVTEKERLVRFIAFVDKSNPEFQYLHENLQSLGHWETTVVSDDTWVNDVLRAVRFRLVEYEGKQLVRCDIVIGNYTLAEGEACHVDPDTNTWYVGASSDDAGVYKGTSVSHPETNWNTLNLTAVACRCGCFGTDERWGHGSRFTGVTVPHGSTINQANYKLYCYDDRNGSQESRIYGEDVDDASTFSTVADYNTRKGSVTTAYVDWDFDGDAAAWSTSPDIKTIIQEIVDREGWSSGNDLVLFHETDENPQQGKSDDLFEAWDRNSGGDEPQLYIDWTSAAATISFDADAILKATLSKTFDTDSILQATFGKDFDVDAFLTAIGSKTFDADAILKATLGKDFSADSILKATLTKTFDADAILQAVFTKTFAADAVLAAYKTKTFDVDAILKASLAKTFAVDAVLSAAGTYTKQFTADSILQATFAKAFDVDAVLKATLGKDFTVDALLKLVLAKTFDADAILKASLTKSWTVDAIVGYVVEAAEAEAGKLPPPYRLNLETSCYASVPVSYGPVAAQAEATCSLAVNLVAAALASYTVKKLVVQLARGLHEHTSILEKYVDCAAPVERRLLEKVKVKVKRDPLWVLEALRLLED